jgi:hypothetical protein
VRGRIFAEMVSREQARKECAEQRART